MRDFIETFLSYGFRPFFLLAGIYAVVPMLAWIAWYWMAADGAVATVPGSFPAHIWHGHEMLLGFTAAVVAGFFLTAMPNWTGREPVHGPLLGALVAVWLAGRLAMWSTGFLPSIVVAALDLAFIPFLAVLVIRTLSGGWSKRNVIFMPILLALFVGNLMVHWDSGGETASRGLMLGLNALTLLMVIIGGRVVPAFTTNALQRRGEVELPRSWPMVDKASILLVAVTLIVEAVWPHGQATAIAAAGAAVANLVRFCGWRGTKVLNEPILWIVHLGYAWLIVGLAAKAMAAGGLWLAPTAAQHALTVGAIGSLTLGVMSRAALGHTGRRLAVAPAVVVAYLLVTAAAIVRVGGALALPGHPAGVAATAGGLWILAFLIFAAVYAPILVGPRRRAEIT